MQQSAAKGIASAKEAELANRLASDDPTERFDAMKEIETLLGESKIKENQYRKVWKALFYGLWVADKVKIQVDMAMRAAKMIHILENASTDTVLTWIKSCFEIFHREWDKIDYWRTSKFLSLARFCLNEVYAFLEGKKWNGTLVRQFNQVLVEQVLGNALEWRSTGLTIHMLQVFVDSLLELNDVPYKVLKALLEPFVELLAHSKDRTVNSKIVEFVFRVFVQNLKEGHFKSFAAQKYAGYLLKKASSKDITEFNRKPLYTVQKEFLHFIAPENPYGVALDLNDDEELGDESIDIEITKKSDTENPASSTEGKKTKKQKKAEKLEKKLETAQASTKTEKKEGKFQAKMEKKQQEKETKTKVKDLNNKKKAQEEEEEEDEDDNDWEVEGEGEEWEDVDEEGLNGDDDMGDFEDELEAEAPTKKNKAAKNNKKEVKGKAEKKDNKNSLKRGRQPLDEEEAEEDMEELPEDWEEELMDENMMEEFNDEEDENETDTLTETEYMQLLQQGLLGKLPPYLFQTPKEQRAFFAKKNKEYFANLEKAKKRPIPHSRKVNFDANKNMVKEFDKKYKLAEGKGDKKVEIPGKGILKKTVIATKTVMQTTTTKNPNKANKKNNKKNNNKKKVKF